MNNENIEMDDMVLQYAQSGRKKEIPQFMQQLTVKLKAFFNSR